MNLAYTTNYSDYLMLDADGGLYIVDFNAFVEYDYSEALPLNHEKFRDVLRMHRGLSIGERVARKTTLSPRDIVVLKYEWEGKTHRNWFVRVSFPLEGPWPFKHHGDYFLWQLPYARCARMASDLRAHLRAGHNPKTADILLRGSPTVMRFEPKHHVGRGTTLLESDYWSTQLAVLCFGAAQSPAPTPQWWGRCYPELLLKEKLWKLSELPDEVSDMILDRLIDNLIHGPLKRDARALLSLRRVNRRLRDKVDAAAVAWTQKKYEALDAALQRNDPQSGPALCAVGRSFLEAGIHPVVPYKTWLQRQKVEMQDGICRRLTARPGQPPIGFCTFCEWKFCKG